MSEPIVIDDDPPATPMLDAARPAPAAVVPVPAAAAAPHRLPVRFATAAVLSDLALAVLAYVVALAVRQQIELGDVQARVSANWSMLIVLGVMLATFYLFGLYERELLLSRALHVLTLLRGVVVAFVIGASAIYLLRLPIELQSRGVVVGAFLLFFVMTALVRAGILTGLYWHSKPATTLVVGDAACTARLRERLH